MEEDQTSATTATTSTLLSRRDEIKLKLAQKKKEEEVTSRLFGKKGGVHHYVYVKAMHIETLLRSLIYCSRASDGHHTCKYDTS